jgi:phosphomannomutase
MSIAGSTENGVTEYHCPGEPYAISRAVHLGRLTRFYPGCRQCAHRDQTGTVSQRLVRQLSETRLRGEPPPLFQREGISGICPNELDPQIARQAAIALGMCLHGQQPADAGAPVALVASDGRATTAPLLAAVCNGLRWAACHVVEAGASTAACLAFAIDHLQAAGGILVGNPADQLHSAGLKFWARGPHPLSAGGGLDELEAVFGRHVDRPTRTFGQRRRFPADEPYLASLAEYYHALRPLRVVVNTLSLPVVTFLETLTARVACQIVPYAGPSERLGCQILAERAHFGIHVADDGEVCHVVDERGRAVAAERLLMLLARQQLTDHPQAAVVLEPGTSAAVAEAIRSWGGQAVFGSATRAAMAEAFRRTDAVLGGGPSGRLWHALGHPSADALRTLTLLLSLLSRSDRPFSEVLDATLPVH